MTAMVRSPPSGMGVREAYLEIGDKARHNIRYGSLADIRARISNHRLGALATEMPTLCVWLPNAGSFSVVYGWRRGG